MVVEQDEFDLNSEFDRYPPESTRDGKISDKPKNAKKFGRGTLLSSATPEDPDFYIPEDVIFTSERAPSEQTIIKDAPVQEAFLPPPYQNPEKIWAETHLPNGKMNPKQYGSKNK